MKADNGDSPTNSTHSSNNDFDSGLSETIVGVISLHFDESFKKTVPLMLQMAAKADKKKSTGREDFLDEDGTQLVKSASESDSFENWPQYKKLIKYFYISVNKDRSDCVSFLKTLGYDCDLPRGGMKKLNGSIEFLDKLSRHCTGNMYRVTDPAEPNFNPTWKDCENLYAHPDREETKGDALAVRISKYFKHRANDYFEQYHGKSYLEVEAELKKEKVEIAERAPMAKLTSQPNLLVPAGAVENGQVPKAKSTELPSTKPLGPKTPAAKRHCVIH